MSLKILLLPLFCLCLFSGAVLGAEQHLVNLGRWNEAELGQIISAAHKLDAPGDQIVEISRHFIDTPYAAGTLVGGPQNPERLTINLAGFDCFTLLDVVEALRRAEGLDAFSEELKQVRYHDGRVSYASRRHFFSDWVADGAALLGDVTAEVAQGTAQVVDKKLNLKSDETLWLPEIPVVQRQITYIPADKIDMQLLSFLRTGDYVGIYSQADGLDVSHTGLVVKEKGKVKLRHASSRNGVNRVIDDDLLLYLEGKPGLLVYRVK